MGSLLSTVRGLSMGRPNVNVPDFLVQHRFFRKVCVFDPSDAIFCSTYGGDLGCVEQRGRKHKSANTNERTDLAVGQKDPEGHWTEAGFRDPLS